MCSIKSNFDVLHLEHKKTLKHKTRKVKMYIAKFQIVYLYLQDCRIRLVNSHLSPFDNETIQGRTKRTDQSMQIVDNLGCNFDVAILGLDLNDIPNSKYISK